MLLFKDKVKLDENIIQKIYQKERITRHLYLLIGTLLIAIAYNLFILPGNIVYGMGGVGVILNKLFAVDPSLVILTGNIILLILSYALLGKEKTTNSVIGAILFPIMIKLTEWVPNYISLSFDQWLFTIYGAVITGFGLGFAFKGGFSTGGTDILNQIVAKYAKISIGNSMIWTDGLIIVGSACVFGVTLVMYSFIALCIISFITDKVILGISSSKAFYIITEHETAIKKFIMTHLNHGVTVLDGRGGYTGNHQKVIMCIIPTKEYFLLKEGIHEIDPNAFFLVTDAYEIYGGE